MKPLISSYRHLIALIPIICTHALISNRRTQPHNETHITRRELAIQQIFYNRGRQKLLRYEDGLAQKAGINPVELNTARSNEADNEPVTSAQEALNFFLANYAFCYAKSATLNSWSRGTRVIHYKDIRMLLYNTAVTRLASLFPDHPEFATEKECPILLHKVPLKDIYHCPCGNDKHFVGCTDCVRKLMGFNRRSDPSNRIKCPNCRGYIFVADSRIHADETLVLMKYYGIWREEKP